MKYIFLGIAVCILIFVLLGLYSKFTSKNKYYKKTVSKPTKVKCPVCNSYLLQGENLISKVYRPMNVPDQLMTVSGCPHCFPVCEPNIQRVCPVCHKNIEQDETLTARLFNKTDGSKHVHIVGCSKCHKPRAK